MTGPGSTLRPAQTPLINYIPPSGSGKTHEIHRCSMRHPNPSSQNQPRQPQSVPVLQSVSIMTTTNSAPNYALGSTDAEHERLIRQAALLAPFTERFFRSAGIGPGQRVLDLGSGVGDVAMLAARLVGPSGEVVGVERDTRSITRAKARVADAGLPNVTFTQSDVSQIASTRLFDAVVGRFILMYLPDPVAVLRSLSRLVRTGGVFAFQESSWAPIFAISTQLPLWSAAVSLMCETFQRSGANPEIGLSLYQIFQEAGLPARAM